MTARRALLFLWLSSSSAVGAAADRDVAGDALRFNRDIRPILADNCFKCHGPDTNARQAELRLDTREGLFQQRDDVTPVVPGAPDQSEVYRRIASGDPDVRMPPPDSGKSLTPAQIERLRRWIEAGAAWEGHWAFIPPQRPPLPRVEHGDWPRNGIDAFVLAGLERRGLTPAEPARSETLARRVALDLTGLPPTPADLDAVRADPSDAAHERLVDRLLASPRYGEHLAVDWLDAARYADSSGYQNDGPRFMWRWRDWVIEAFNANKPFDRFTVEQLAGDLLLAEVRNAEFGVGNGAGGTGPRPVDRAGGAGTQFDESFRIPNSEFHIPDEHALNLLIATAFNRNHRGNSEGGIVPEEYAVEYVVDRVDTTAAVWLGLTIGCARCHDHKYDPISQTEYYRLFAYFNNVPENGRAVKEDNSPPYIKAPTREQVRAHADLKRRLAAAHAAWGALRSETRAAQREWERTLDPHAPIDWTLTDGLLARFPLDGQTGDVTPSERPAKLSTGDPVYVDSPVGRALSLDGDQFVDAGDIAKFGYFDAFSVSAWIRPDSENGELTGGIVTRVSDDVYADGWALHLDNGHVQVNLVKRWLDDALRVETETRVRPGEWQHVLMTYDGTRVAKGVAVYIGGERQPLRVNYDFLNQTMTNEEPLRIGSHGTLRRFRGAIADARVYGRALSAEEALVVATPEPVNVLAGIPAEKRTSAQAHTLREYFLAHAAPAAIRDADRAVRDLTAELAQFERSIPTVMIMAEMEPPRETHVLQRGVYDKPGERVTPGIPAVLNVERNSFRSLPASSAPKPNEMNSVLRSNRLDLARWLVDPGNPLTARVTVNRLWQRIFGTGLVKTSEDFGIQGEPPSHPELLDWLAVELVESGWDLKHIQRLIVTSNTYRQASRMSPDLARLDPENRLLARGPRFRMPAEMVRDQALAAAGLLDERLGGPSVKPYQPPGLWQEIATDTEYAQSTGPDLYRRSLYSYWKRTVANPTLTLFDAATRESCTLSRSRTNTPLQALTLLNDVTFVEAARALAGRALREGGASADERITFLVTAVAPRAPRSDELSLLRESLERHRRHYAADREVAQALIESGDSAPDPDLDPVELAAYTVVAGVVLNLDEVITKE
jgi:hypothetical protein